MPHRYPITDATKADFLETIEAVQGNLTRARFILGLSHKSMYRYCIKLRLWEDIDRIRGVSTDGIDYEKLYRESKTAPNVPIPNYVRATLARMARRRAMG